MLSEQMKSFLFWRAETERFETTTFKYVRLFSLRQYKRFDGCVAQDRCEYFKQACYW